MWGFRLRCFTLLGAGALGVHELRYLVGYGGEAGGALARQGHGYLDAVTAGVGLALVAALAGLLAALVRGAGPQLPARPWRVRWLAASAALLAAYTVQELVEGALSPGHPAGLAGVAGHGGWIAVALALAIGAAVAAVLRGADAVIARFASPRESARRRRPPRATLPRAPLAIAPGAAAGLAAPGAPRGPPLPTR